MGWIASIALKLFTGSTLSFVSNIVTSLTNEKVAVVTAQTGLAATEVVAVVDAEKARVAAQSQIQMAQMTHPIWWVAWTLFVIPVGLYDALIHMKSVLVPFYPSVLHWNIPEVPAQIEAWDMYVILSMFGLAVTSSVVTSIVGRLGKTG